MGDSNMLRDYRRTAAIQAPNIHKVTGRLFSTPQLRGPKVIGSGKF
jgi:hypothetical protein